MGIKDLFLAATGWTDVRLGNVAREQQDWATAARHYEKALRTLFFVAPLWVQLGNMAKEARNFPLAERAYRRGLKLRPRDADIHLQLGHLHKLMGSTAKAAEDYRRAYALDLRNGNAFTELAAIGLERDAVAMARRKSSANGKLHRLFIDVTDLIAYIGHHAHLSGIQRVQCSIILSLVRDGLVDPGTLEFVTFDRGSGHFRMVSTGPLLALLEDLTRSQSDRQVGFNQQHAKDGVLYAGGPIHAVIEPDKATFLMLGAAWTIPDYAKAVMNLKRDYRCRFVMFFHDLIPIYARETCHEETADEFVDFIDQIVGLVDHALCNSKNTASDLERYCQSKGFAVPPTTVTRLGSSFSEIFELERSGETGVVDRSTPFVLFVSTIEGRKNHAYALKIWQSLIRSGVDVPQMVCVGRIGWRMESFLKVLKATDNLGGKIKIIHDVSDTELSRLYEDSLFTLYPTLYEGWGLPIGESLAHGTPVVVSDTPSVAEVAGDFGVQIPLGDVRKAASIVRKLIEQPTELESLRKKIRDDYRPDLWKDVAQRVVTACSAAAAAPPRLTQVEAEIDRLYPFRSLRVLHHRPTKRGASLPDESSLIDALRMRAIGWWEPEDWGCWTRGKSATLDFVVDPITLPANGQVDVELAIRLHANAGTGTLNVAANNVQQTAQIDAKTDFVRLALPVDAFQKAPRLSDGRQPVTLELTLDWARDGKALSSPRKDKRPVGFGLCSLRLSVA